MTMSDQVQHPNRRTEAALKAAEDYADKHSEAGVTNHAGGIMRHLVSIIMAQTESTPRGGWFVFGSHVDFQGPLEFSEEVGEDGLPRWERHRETEITEDMVERAAKVLYEFDGFVGPVWGDLAENVKNAYRRHVRAILSAALGEVQR